MKSRILALVAVFMLCIVSVMAQSPGRFNYQGVVRDASNNAYTNQNVGIRFTVLNSSLVSVYTETQSLTSNGLGLVNTTIGDGNPTTFNAVEWGSDEYLLQIELDLGDNGSWETDEIQALNTVPYAMHAATADLVLGDSIWKKQGNNLYYNEGSLGIGTSSPDGKVHIQGEASWADEDPLFEVKNADGVPVFAVYNNGVRILVEDDPNAKGRPRGGFSVGGFDRAGKGETYDFMRISPDSIRFNIDNSTVTKGVRGGFAVGGFDRAGKGPINEDFMYITPVGSADGLLNTFLGFHSGENNGGEHNTFIGSYAGISNRGGSYNNFIGFNAGNGNMSGNSNCFIGNGAGESNNGGSGNVFLGNGSGMNNTEGIDNIYIGTNSGLWHTKGNNNIIIGIASGGNPMEERNNTIKIGAYAGFDDPGSDRLFIDGSPDGRDFSTSLIYGSFADGAKELRVNGSIYYTGNIGEVSDSRLKTNLYVIDNVLDKIQELNGYYFDWNSTAKESLIVNEKHQIGVLAQDIEKVFPELVSEMEEGYKTVDYAKLTPVLLQAVKEQQATIESLSNEVDELKQMVAAILEKQE